MKKNLVNAISQLPEEIQAHVESIISAPDFKGVISSQDVDQLQLLSKLETPALLLSLLPIAAAYSVAPISNFNVGAIARGASGDLYLGANYEFNQQNLSHSVHAEQAAINNAFSHHEAAILDVTVTASPCGHCRQFMNELSCAPNLCINLQATGVKPLSTLLPDSFGPIDLGITEALLAAKPVSLKFEDPQSELAEIALKAANDSYAPYSQCHAGIAMRTTSGAIICGRYIENAAFNPSFSPLQSAMINLNLAGYNVEDIAEIILVEQADTKISHANATEDLLKELALSGDKYQRILAH